MRNSISSYKLANNNQFIVFNKPAGIPFQKGKSDMTSFHEMAMAYCKHDLYVVHRLDQPVSGVVVFAKNKKAAANLSAQFKAGDVQKSYLAVVPLLENGQSDTAKLEDYLKKDGRTNKSAVVAADEEDAKKAILSYQKVADIENYSLLEISLETGRHHQIRTQLSAADMPVKGDVKYGSRRSNKDKSIHLHAHQLTFSHPVTKEKKSYKAKLPEDDPVWTAFAEIIKA